MKKNQIKIKLLIVLFLALSFIILGRTNCSYCTDEGTLKMNTKINPIYEDVLSKEEKEYIKEELNNEDTVKERSNSNRLLNTYEATRYTSYSKLVNAVKSNMVKRKTKITFIWEIKKIYNNDTFGYFIEDLMSDATSEKYAKTSDEGNYLNLNYYAANAITNRVQYNTKTKYYLYTITMNVKYHTTAKQEEQLNKMVNNYIKSYKNTGKKSQYQIISDFNDYICNKVTYDNKHNNTYMLKYTAYAALINGTAVCQGYTTLYYKLLDNMGIRNTIVTSDTINHIWNLVEYNGKWYQVDTTWNDTNDQIEYRQSNFLWGIYDHPTSGHNYSDVTVNWGQSTPSYTLAYHGINVDSNVKVNDFTATSFEEPNPTLNWTVPTGVDGVIIRDADTTKVVGKFTNAQTSMAVSNVVKGKEYNFEICTYKLVNGEEQYSIPTKVTAFTRPNAVTGFKASSAGYNYVTLAWNKYSTVTGYKIYKYNPSTKKYEYCKRTSATSCKVTGLKTASNYSFRVIAYLKVNGKEYDGKNSVVLTTGTSTKVPAISKLSTKKKKVTINWKKISGTIGYEIYMRKGTKGSYKKIKTAGSKTVKYTKSKLKKGTKYYFKIRTYRTVKGKKVYSSYSKVKSIKVK